MKLSIGPGAMVAAAFIGPGTVTTATATGAATGLTLAWAILLSIIATLVLQELAVRLALATNMDLAQLIRQAGTGHWWRMPVIALVVIAIGVGNAAYQSGNLSGAAIGLSSALPIGFDGVVLLTSTLAGVLIVLDRYRLLEGMLVFLVGMMAVLFIGLALFCLPALLALEPDRLLPSLGVHDATLVLALIGTTVVPYNLFLHATAARRRWSGVPVGQAILEAKAEATLAILVGGVITFALMAVAAAVLGGAEQEGVLNALMQAVNQRAEGWGTWVVGGGLFAAGLTSAIAAPVAAGWAVCGALGLSTAPNSRAFKVVALTVLAIGWVFAVVTQRPVGLIVTAQATNAVLLPLVALLLLGLANSNIVPGSYRNSRSRNAASGVVVLVILLLAGTKLWTLLA